MTQREKIIMLKSTIEYLFEKEGRSKSYISRVLEVDRKTLSEIMNNEWNLKQAQVRYLKPSNQKFLNKHKNLIKSRLDNDINITDIATELGVTRHYLSGTIIVADDVLDKANKDRLNRVAIKAEDRKMDFKLKSSHNYFFEDLEGEIWRDIKGYSLYKVSNFGRVKSYKKSYNDYILLNLTENSRQENGRLYVSMIGDNKKRKNLQVSRIVGHSFVEGFNPQTTNTINHKNGNKTDNRADNLEWVSQSENNQHSYDELNRKTSIGYTKHGKYKKIILNNKYEFKTKESLARFIGVSVTQLNRYIDGECEHNYFFKFIY